MDDLEKMIRESIKDDKFLKEENIETPNELSINNTYKVIDELLKQQLK